ncbi:MAG: HPr family phosphocarrier protein [Lachnospiraceae bacterium]|nr:HPr family phosphocarrier protein [Lachnospiraceae bacterium]
MQQVFVKFDDVDQVRSFVNVVNSVEANFELGSGRRIVDPKSILGVFALDLARPQKLVCDSDDSAMLEKIGPFLVGERAG